MNSIITEIHYTTLQYAFKKHIPLDPPSKGEFWGVMLSLFYDIHYTVIQYTFIRYTANKTLNFKQINHRLKGFHKLLYELHYYSNTLYSITIYI